MMHRSWGQSQLAHNLLDLPGDVSARINVSDDMAALLHCLQLGALARGSARMRSYASNGLTGHKPEFDVRSRGPCLQTQRSTEQADQSDDDQVNRDNEIQQLGHDENQDASNQRNEGSKCSVHGEVILFSKC